jgi:hypothetical protein
MERLLLPTLFFSLAASWEALVYYMLINSVLLSVRFIGIPYNCKICWELCSQAEALLLSPPPTWKPDSAWTRIHPSPLCPAQYKHKYYLMKWITS